MYVSLPAFPTVIIQYTSKATVGTYTLKLTVEDTCSSPSPNTVSDDLVIVITAAAVGIIMY